MLLYVLINLSFLEVTLSSEELVKTMDYVVFTKDIAQDLNATLEDASAQIRLISQFDERDLNLWTNLMYYQSFQTLITKNFKGELRKLPEPRYPIFVVVLKTFMGRQILKLFPPTNFIELAKFLREELGSGITIKSKDLIYEELDLKDKTEKEIKFALLPYEFRTQKIAQMKFYGNKIDGRDFIYTIDVNYEDFPNIDRLLRKEQFKDASLSKVVFYQNVGKILKQKHNSRILLPHSELPEKILNAFMLVEDDYFYIEPGGIDLPGLFKAAVEFIRTSSKKGNASITEQVYEMYLGKRIKKGPLDKLTQIIGAIYLNHFNKNKRDILDLYAQSITGSFWTNHNYGISGLVKSYLNKDRLEDLTWREIAWISRIALNPNTIGQDYARFHIYKNMMAADKLNIDNDDDVNRFIERQHREEQRLLLPKDRTPVDATIQKQFLSYIKKLRASYSTTEARINLALKNFYHGNPFVKPLITKKEYEEALQDKIVFTQPDIINTYQSYTDQTLLDVDRYIGSWARNAGLQMDVAFDESAQRILDDKLKASTRKVYGFVQRDFNYTTKNYGGASILIKTHNIKEPSHIENRIVAISSHHTKSTFYNWATQGIRQFGSTIKWLILLKYLDGGGTLLDTLWDIPREFYPVDENCDINKKEAPYTPDNYPIESTKPYGWFTWSPETMIYNFIYSKNNVFVHLAEEIGLCKLVKFLNEVGELEDMSDFYRFKPLYSIALGTQEINSVRFAKMLSVITNYGILKPLTSLEYIELPNQKKLTLEVKEKQMVSREAAEQALFVGYLNPYFGTSKRFIPGGAAKTGSANTDVSFVAMTTRTPDQYIEGNPDHSLNSNYLYLVNIGVNSGEIDDGLFGGNIAAMNAKEVFDDILEYAYKTREYRFPIGGDFTKYFSSDLEMVPYNRFRYPNGKIVEVPVKKENKVTYERGYSDSYLMSLRLAYENRKDDKQAFESQLELGLIEEGTQFNSSYQDYINGNYPSYQLNALQSEPSFSPGSDTNAYYQSYLPQSFQTESNRDRTNENYMIPPESELKPDGE